jgi:hypothetical protein
MAKEPYDILLIKLFPDFVKPRPRNEDSERRKLTVTFFSILPFHQQVNCIEYW